MYGDDLRLGDIIVHGDQGNIVLLGFPYDEGVTRNSGRAGAKFGPSKFREFLRRTGTVVNPEYDDVDLRKYLTISDGGNIEEDLCLEEAHQRLQKRVRDLLYQEKIVFVVGGGNDQSYPNASALLDYLQSKSKSIVVINIDAHLDVRPLKNGHQAHSGSPFRQLLEDQRFNGNPMNRFIEFSCQGSQCSIEHVRYIQSKSPLTRLLWYKDIRDDPARMFAEILQQAQENQSDVFVSFDIDSIISSSCPGVSAPSTVGLTSEQALQLSFLAGKYQNVRLFDLSEFNPIVEDYRTGKLVTLLFYNFLLGRASVLREQSPTTTN